MGLALEIIFLFFAINYLGIQFLGDKMADSEYKYRQEEIASQKAAEDAARQAALKETEARRKWAEDVEGFVISDTSCRGYGRDVERECVEVFKCLPSWSHITEWNTAVNLSRYYEYAKRVKTKQADRDSEKKEFMDWADDVTDIIYFANRGKLPKRLLNYRQKHGFPIYASDCELMLWWRDKLRSFGIDHELWFCYSDWVGNNSSIELYKCTPEYPAYSYMSSSTGYHWDTEYNAISRYQTKIPSCITDANAAGALRFVPQHRLTRSAISTDYLMRIPTKNEWDILCAVYDILQEQQFDVRSPSLLEGELCGRLAVWSVDRDFILPGWLSWNKYLNREKYSEVSKGCSWDDDSGYFRPAFELTTDDIYEIMSYEIGKAYVIGTLYMEGKPVRITTGDAPIEVSCNKRGVKLYEDPPIEHYEFTSILELGEPREDPQYQIMGIYIGDGVFISRDILLDKMSYSDVIWSINKAKELRAIAENNG